MNTDALPFALPSRYPARRNGKEVYVLREFLTYRERRANIARLRRARKFKHAEALEAETTELVRQGKLTPGNPERDPRIAENPTE